MSGHIEAVVNREVVDPKLHKKDGVLWWRVANCPLEGCKHFKKAEAWSMFGPDDVKSTTSTTSSLAPLNPTAM